MGLFTSYVWNAETLLSHAVNYFKTQVIDKGVNAFNG